MKGPRFKAAILSILDYIGEGMMWMGPMWADPGAAAVLDQDHRPVTPLSAAERAEWAALVERLR